MTEKEAIAYIEDPKNDCIASFDRFSGWEIGQRDPRSDKFLLFSVKGRNICTVVESLIKTMSDR